MKKILKIKFFEEKTPFKRGIFSPTTDSFKLGYRMKNGVEADDSWSSSLLSVSANNNPDCAIGKDAVTIKFFNCNPKPKNFNLNFINHKFKVITNMMFITN
jgi:hypothetical protein